MLPWQNRFCCCLSLRTGGLIMGSLSLFFSLLAAAALAVTYVDRVYISRVLAHYKLNHYHEEAFSSRGSVFNAVHEVLDEFKEEDDHFPPADDQEVQNLILTIFLFCVIGMILVSIYLATCVFLIYGSAKGKRWFIMPWIVNTFALLLVVFILVCVCIWYFRGQMEILGLLAFSVAQNVVAFYLWICIVSLFQLLSCKRNALPKGVELKTISSKYVPVPTSD